MPTVLEAAGTSYPDKHKEHPVTPLEGKSLIPVFKEDTAAPRVLFWEHQGNKAARQGDWKAIQSDGMEWQLFDLSQDPTESTDLSEQQPERLAGLKALWQAWAKRCSVLR